ncbi:glycosyltransferase family 39 protein [Marinomonas sp. CT5]|uniref:ArnT family glycosyltransferase n=1 Tax=Marinomonas sp. CT5 TaxID=2066133 RepID=UPI001BAF259C|nr:glycosyltransferase family 39 protein [Marinomonas sp. CT5]
MRDVNLIKWYASAPWKIILLISIALVVFSGLFNHDVWTPDEPRVAAIVKNMYLSGNFIIPQFADIPFVEKPPLFFIFAVSLMHLTGLDPVMAGRLGLAVFCLGSLAVTFRLACLIRNREYAWVSLGVLATLEGFIVNFHWLRVDAALVFTSIAAIWAFAEAYLNLKMRYLLLAGALTGLAFLSKGPIAIAICIAPAWLALFMRYVYLRKHENTYQSPPWKTVALYHFTALLIMCLVIGAWVYPFYLQASPELWHAWFWENQVGRMTGASTGTLGHNHQGEPFFYVSGIFEYSFPWIIFLAISLIISAKKLITRSHIHWVEAFLFFWFIFAVVILSYSSTKRSMYLAPLTPLFALLAADVAMKIQGSWVTWYRRLCLTIMLLLLAIFAVTPLWVKHLPSDKIPTALMEWLSTWQMTALWVILAIALMIKVEATRWPNWTKLALITSLFFTANFYHLFVAIDIAKDMKKDLHTLVQQIPDEKRARTAGIRFTETMSSIFYLYEEWPVPLVDKERAKRILEGKDKDYEYLLIDRNNTLQEPLSYIGLSNDIPYEVLVIGHPRSDKVKDAVFWLKGSVN